MSPRGFVPRPLRDRQGDGYPLPPALAKLPSGRGRLARECLARDQRDRILRGALEVFGTKGLTSTSVQDLVGAAAVSRETFYRFFASKEDCFRALHDEVLGWLEEEARDAAAAVDGWAGGV